MTYKIPKCVCGMELVYSEAVTQERLYKIKSNGRPFKTPLKTFNGGMQQSNLHCRRCKLTYAIDSYTEGPLLRGGLISYYEQTVRERL